MNQPLPTAKDSNTSIELSGFETLPSAELLQGEDQVQVIQKLLQSNQSLLAQIATLEPALESCQVELRSSTQQSLPSTTPQIRNLSIPADCCIVPQPLKSSDPASLAPDFPQRNAPERKSPDAKSPEHLTQEQMIATLTEKLESSLQQIADFERNSVVSQQRQREQAHRIRQLEQDYQLLQRRVQREQNYSLQLKTALEKTLREQQADPSWLEQLWLQLSREGNLIEPAPAIASWAADIPSPQDPLEDNLDVALDIDIEALVAHLDSDQDCPWSASQVLFLDEQDEFFTRPPVVSIELPPLETRVTTPTSHPDFCPPLVLSQQPSPAAVASPPPEVNVELPEQRYPSCSFQLVERPPSPPPAQQRPSGMVDLPPFLQRN